MIVYGGTRSILCEVDGAHLASICRDKPSVVEVHGQVKGRRSRLLKRREARAIANRRHQRLGDVEADDQRIGHVDVHRHGGTCKLNSAPAIGSDDRGAINAFLCCIRSHRYHPMVAGFVADVETLSTFVNPTGSSEYCIQRRDANCRERAGHTLREAVVEDGRGEQIPEVSRFSTLGPLHQNLFEFHISDEHSRVCIL